MHVFTRSVVAMGEGGLTRRAFYEFVVFKIIFSRIGIVVASLDSLRVGILWICVLFFIALG